MKYIKITNTGELDVVTACNCFGMSVKKSADSIGMFGSGLKYALAQCARMKIALYITSGGRSFRLSTKSDNFRDTGFNRLTLVDQKSKKIYDLPMADSLGSHDWKEEWGIYREIVCNAIDEKDYDISISDSVIASRGKTSFYLEYEPFEEIHNNFNSYFKDDCVTDWVRPGTGIIYKKGIRVGKFESMDIDANLNGVRISEAREMDEYSAMFNIGFTIRHSKDQDAWVAFITSKNNDRIPLDLTYADDSVIHSMKAAMETNFGNYVIAPDDESIQKDLKAMNIQSFVVPTCWELPLSQFPSYRDVTVFERKFVRDPLDGPESEMIAWANDLAILFKMDYQGEVKVITKDELKDEISGQSDIDDGIIFLSKSIFKNKIEFLTTYLHEVGHVLSGYGDYDRGFADFFIGRIVDFALEDS